MLAVTTSLPVSDASVQSQASGGALALGGISGNKKSRAAKGAAGATALSAAAGAPAGPETAFSKFMAAVKKAGEQAGEPRAKQAHAKAQREQPIKPEAESAARQAVVAFQSAHAVQPAPAAAPGNARREQGRNPDAVSGEAANGPSAAAGRKRGNRTLVGDTRTPVGPKSPNLQRPAPAAADKADSTGNAGEIDRKKAGLRLSVVDLRIKAFKEKSAEAGSAEAPRERNAGAEPAGSIGFQGARPAPLQETGRSATDAGNAAPAGQAQSLAARLRVDGAADIVRAAQVVLRDGEMGMIRLRLEPETLGGVKIELKMAEKQISGRIVVESDLAGEAFRSSLDALRDAFAEAGFETTSLEVEVRGGNGGADGQGPDQAEPYWSAGFRELGRAVPTLEAGGAATGLNMIV